MKVFAQVIVDTEVGNTKTPLMPEHRRNLFVSVVNESLTQNGYTITRAIVTPWEYIVWTRSENQSDTEILVFILLSSFWCSMKSIAAAQSIA